MKIRNKTIGEGGKMNETKRQRTERESEEDNKQKINWGERESLIRNYQGKHKLCGQKGGKLLHNTPRVIQRQGRGSDGQVLELKRLLK